MSSCPEPAMPSKVANKCNFFFTVFLIDLMGIGLRGRNIVQWFLLATGVIHRILLFRLSFWTFEFSVTRMTYILITLNPLVQVVLVIGRVKLLSELLCNSNKLSERSYFILRVVDAVVFFSIVSQLALEFSNEGWSHCSSMRVVPRENNSTLIKMSLAVLCFNELLLYRDMDMFCGLYLLIFLITYFIKVDNLNSIFSPPSYNWKHKMFTLSSEMSMLTEKLEDSTSCILFIRTIHQFLSISTFFFLAMFMSARNVTFNFTSAVWAFSCTREIVLTVLLLLSISLMQEDIERRCEHLSERILLSGLLDRSTHENWVLQQAFTCKFTRKVTIWKVVEVSRGILITLASAYVGFPVLFWEINNGALAMKAPENRTI